MFLRNESFFVIIKMDFKVEENLENSRKNTELKENDYKFLTVHTGLSKNEINRIFVKFMEKNSNGKLNRTEFSSLVKSLEPEDADGADKILEFLFRAFDTDKDGLIDFNEFMIGYV